MSDACSIPGAPRTAAPPAPSIAQVLAEQGVYVGAATGRSMWPMLRDRRDTVVLEPPRRPLTVGDVVLYRRGGSYVLHRMVDQTGDAYVILGDNCLAYEQVPANQVLGVLTGFYRGERAVDMGGWRYRAYMRLWQATTPLRRLALRALGAARRLGRTPLAKAGRPRETRGGDS